MSEYNFLVVIKWA